MDNTQTMYSTVLALLLVLHTTVAQCPGTPCQNGAICLSDGSCQCMNTGYAGMYCEFIIQQSCDPDPCLNGGACTVDPANVKGYVCNCMNTGYTGGICERMAMVNGQCSATVACLNGGSCTNNVCACGPANYGALCENTKATVGFELVSVSVRENEGMYDMYLTRTDNTDITTEVLVTPRYVDQAELGVDYAFSPNPMTETFGQGNNRRRIDLEILEDNIPEGDERFELVITVVDPISSRVDPARAVATVTIEVSDGGSNIVCTTPSDCNGAICSDNVCDCTSIGDYFGQNCEYKKAIVGFEEGRYSFGEGDGDEVVFVSREFGIDFETEIVVTATPLSAEAGVDYNFNPNPLTEILTVNLTRKPINFEIIQDEILEGEEQFQLEVTVIDPTIARVSNRNTTMVIIRANDGGAPDTQDCNTGGMMSECINQGTCNADGTCSCTEEWMGGRCERPHACSNTAMPPCINGECIVVSGDPNFACVCPDTFTGGRCDVPVMPVPGNGDGNNDAQGGLSTTATIAIAVVVSVVVLVIFIVIIVVYCKRRGKGNKGPGIHRATSRDNTYAPGAHFINQKKGARRQATVYDKAERKVGSEFPREKLKLHEHLGSGAFANVVRAEAMGIVRRGVKTVVAVKMLKETATDSDRTDFAKELQVYEMLGTHPNIIVMLGHCTDRDPRYLIIEYAPHGNLQTHLRDIRNSPESPYTNLDNGSKNFLTPNEVLTFASQIASGMTYLESKQCIHRDLATRNVLLGDGLVCKLSDFGLARDISEQNAYEMQSRGRVPVRWMAPESLLENSYTSKSDVWSFAVTMWELVTVGSHPYPGMSSKKVIDELQKGYRLPKPEHSSEDIYELMLECWRERPEKRPTFSQIHRKLESMLEDAQGYLVMNEFNADNYMYLDPDQESNDSSVENDEHTEAAGVV